MNVSMSRRNSFNTIAASLMLATILSVNAQPVPQTASPDQRLQLAESAANRIVDRFHQTLDFKSIFADEFVNDGKLRTRAVSMDDETRWGRFDVETRARVYVALITF